MGMVTVKFIPQKWSGPKRDYTENVEPPGPDTWQVPVKRVQGIQPFTLDADHLAREEEAPEWVREWALHFPFEVEWDDSLVPEPTPSVPARILLANDKLVKVDDCGYGTVKCSLGIRELITLGNLKGLIEALSTAGTGSPNIIDAVYSVTHAEGNRVHFDLTGNLNQCR